MEEESQIDHMNNLSAVSGCRPRRAQFGDIEPRDCKAASKASTKGVEGRRALQLVG